MKYRNIIVLILCILILGVAVYAIRNMEVKEDESLDIDEEEINGTEELKDELEELDDILERLEEELQELEEQLEEFQEIEEPKQDLEEEIEELEEELEEEMEDLREIMDQQAIKYPNVFFIAGPDTERRIALTFDDGPDGLNTPRLLDILAEKNVKATFFLLGENVNRFPEITRRIHNEGHQIGNHSWSHPNFREMNSQIVIYEEIIPTSEEIENITGVFPQLLRPPYGAISDNTIEILADKNWRIVNWSIDSYDWHFAQDTPYEIINRIERLHHPGGIILFHNNIQNRVTVEAMPNIIDFLREQGYRFNTIEELLF